MTVYRPHSNYFLLWALSDGLAVFMQSIVGMSSTTQYQLDRFANSLNKWVACGLFVFDNFSMKSIFKDLALLGGGAIAKWS